jgi:HK97 family phage major capsid protein
MKNLDNVKNMEALRAELFASMQEDDAQAQEAAFMNFAEGLQNAIIADAKNEVHALNEETRDENVLINRGTMKALTSAEKKYFNAVIERKGFEGVEETFPKTIITEVFKNLKEDHPLLAKIDMQNTSGLVQMIYANPNAATAFWGPICEDIKQIILSGLKVVDVKASRLSGFIPVCKGMLELGENWLAEYVIQMLSEIMAASLELAVVAGTGKNEPIGMMKKLSGATDSVYPDKDKVTLADLKPETLAGIRAAMAEARTDNSNVCLVVNPRTYWAKVFPALIFRADSGEWVLDRLATGEEIIPSYAVPNDILIIGDPQNYLLAVAGETRLEKYSETLAIEDMELYIAKFYGAGVPKDKNAFFVADVSGVKGVTVPPLEKVTANTGDNSASTIKKTTEKPGV